MKGDRISLSPFLSDMAPCVVSKEKSCIFSLLFMVFDRKKCMYNNNSVNSIYHLDSLLWSVYRAVDGGMK